MSYYAVEIEYRIITNKVVEANSEEEAIKAYEEISSLKPEFIVRKEAKAIG